MEDCELEARKEMIPTSVESGTKLDHSFLEDKEKQEYERL
jgi:hypothetical protein